jgi:ribonuclease P protein component
VSPAPARAERFPRAERILRRTDFLQVQREGKRVHTPHFVIMLQPGAARRIGITVTKRAANAVGRNRVRRLVREVYRRNRELFPEQCELVLVARKGAEQLDYATLRAEIAAAQPALQRAARAGKKPSEAAP